MLSCARLPVRLGGINWTCTFQARNLACLGALGQSMQQNEMLISFYHHQTIYQNRGWNLSHTQMIDTVETQEYFAFESRMLCITSLVLEDIVILVIYVFLIRASCASSSLVVECCRCWETIADFHCFNLRIKLLKEDRELERRRALYCSRVRRSPLDAAGHFDVGGSNVAVHAVHLREKSAVVADCLSYQHFTNRE